MTHHPQIKAGGYALSLLIPTFPLLGFALHFNGLAPLLVFAVLPLMGLVIGLDKSPALYDTSQHSTTRKILAALPRLWVALWWCGLVLGTHLLTNSKDLSFAGDLGFILGLAISSAFGTAVSHELIHRQTRLDRALGRCIMTTCGLGHLVTEHLHHHGHAVTPVDSSTPRVDEGLYAFTWRASMSGMRYSLALARTTKFSEGIYLDLVCLAALYAVFFLLWQWLGLLVLVTQAFFAMLCFEAINYLQHYGLERNQGEPFSARHAWSHGCWLTNCLTFNLPMHSDHHAHPDKPYYELLRLQEDSPRLPACYMVMFFCALVPPLFRWVMRAPLARQRGQPTEPT